MACRITDPQMDNPAPDQRADKRFTLILRSGKLITAAGEFVCVLRDVSSGGLKVRLFHTLALDSACEIELSGGERYRLEPAWQQGDEAGLQFADGPVDIEQFLEEAGPFPKRAIRLGLRGGWPVRLHGNGAILPAVMCDLSQHGSAVLCGSRLPVGQLVKIEAEGLGTIEARVRWRRGERYGLVFQQSFRLDALARMAHRLQSANFVPDPAIGAVGVNH